METASSEGSGAPHESAAPTEAAVERGVEGKLEADPSPDVSAPSLSSSSNSVMSSPPPHATSASASAARSSNSEEEATDSPDSSAKQQEGEASNAKDETAASSSRHLRFEPDIFPSWRVAASKVGQGRLLLEAFATGLQNLGSALKDFSVGVDSAAACLSPQPLEGSSSAGAALSMACFLSRLSGHSRDLADAYSQEIYLHTIAATVANHRSALAQACEEGEKAQRQLNDAAAEMQLKMTNYVKRSKEACLAVEAAQAASTAPPATRTAFAMECIRTSTEARRARLAYENSVEVLVQTRRTYEERIKRVLRCLDTLERKRVYCLKDSLTKFVVFSAATLRSCTYDLEQAAKALEEVDVDRDISHFVESHRPEAPMEIPQVENWVSLENKFGEALNAASQRTRGEGGFGVSSSAAASASSVAGVAKQLLQSSTLSRVVQSAASLAAYSVGANESLSLGSNGEGAFANQTLRAPPPADATAIRKLEAEADAILDLIWSEGELTSADCEHLLTRLPFWRSALSSSLRRHVFLQQLASTRKKHAETDAGSQALMPSVLQLRLLGLLCEWLLDASEAQLDVWSGRALLLIAVQIAADGSASADPQNFKRESASSPWRWTVALQQRALEAQQEERTQRNSGKKAPEECQKRGASLKDVGADASSAPSARPSSDAHSKGGVVRWSLHRCLYHHRYWNRVAFWEEAMTLTISEELQRQQLVEKWKSLGAEEVARRELEFRASNPCSGLLHSFGSFMILYGISRAQVCSLIRQVSEQLRLDAETKELLLQGVVQLSEDAKESATSAEGARSDGESLESSHRLQQQVQTQLLQMQSLTLSEGPPKQEAPSLTKETERTETADTDLMAKSTETREAPNK